MEQVAKRPSRPVVPYFGGKWKIADWICQHIPKHHTYVEPFGGAASVLMRKAPAKVEVYNDLGQEIVNLFRVLRNRQAATELQRLLRLTPYSRQEWIDCHERISDPVEQARRTVVISVMSCNAGKAIRRQSNGWKSHSKRHTHPQSFARHTEALSEVVDRLKGCIIENRAAMDVMKQHDGSETAFYVDPPYLSSERKDQREMYAIEKLTAEEHKDLSVFLKTLNGSVILSGYPSQEYKDWFESEGWEVFSTKSSDGSSQKGKSMRTEVLWLNPKAADSQRQKLIF